MPNEIQKAKAEKNAIDLAAKLTPFEAAAFSGDLARLTGEERGVYLLQYCQTMGINPLSGAIQFLMLDGRLVIYATKSCTQQLASRDKVTVKTTEPKVVCGILMCEAVAEMRLPDGLIRTANNIGAVPWDDKMGAKEKCNAMMKVVTKAERRVILSICGLGIMDETELDTVERSRYKRVTGQNFDVLEQDPPEPQSRQQNAPQAAQRPVSRPPVAPEAPLKDAKPKEPYKFKPSERELMEEIKEWMAGMGKTKDQWLNEFAPGKKWAELNYDAKLADMLALKAQNAQSAEVPFDTEPPAFSEQAS